MTRRGATVLVVIASVLLVGATVTALRQIGAVRLPCLYQDIGRFEFWKFDLAGKKFVSRTEFAGRPRMSLKTSSNGQVLYIYNAGATIDLYDAATYKFMKAIQLVGDATTEMFVFPPAQAGTH